MRRALGSRDRRRGEPLARRSRVSGDLPARDTRAGPAAALSDAETELILGDGAAAERRLAGARRQAVLLLVDRPGDLGPSWPVCTMPSWPWPGPTIRPSPRRVQRCGRRCCGLRWRVRGSSAPRRRRDRARVGARAGVQAADALHACGCRRDACARRSRGRRRAARSGGGSRARRPARHATRAACVLPSTRCGRRRRPASRCARRSPRRLRRATGSRCDRSSGHSAAGGLPQRRMQRSRSSPPECSPGSPQPHRSPTSSRAWRASELCRWLARRYSVAPGSCSASRGWSRSSTRVACRMGA